MTHHDRVRALCLAAAAILPGACGTLGGTRDPLAVYDLGLAAPVTPAPVVVPARVEVRAPSWLATAAMQYRLDYEQPAQRQTFTASRWVSPPAEMLERSLNRAFSMPSGGSADSACRLRLELDEFSQVFDSPQGSKAVLVARAELLPAHGDGIIARRLVSFEIAAASADAKGGVAAHQQGSRQLAGELAGWLGSLDADKLKTVSGGPACRR